MYTGLIQEIGHIVLINKREGVTRISVDASKKFLSGLRVGSSIALNGICLSVTKVTKYYFCLDVTEATAFITNLKDSSIHDRVNLERSAVAGGEVGGHLTAGHIDGTGRITAITQLGEAIELLITVPDEIMRYVFAKGFLAVNGASLTVATVVMEERTLTFNLIPETLRQTTFSSAKVGDSVNIEVEPSTRVLVDTLRRNLPSLILH